MEHKKETVNEIGTQMAARVTKDVDADILGVVEAEDRVALQRFNEQVLGPLKCRYEQIMLSDGNDERGIDVGVMTKRNWRISRMTSHVDDTIDGQHVFSRDCPEYLVESGTSKVLVLVNHFKSKEFGLQADSDARRQSQARRVREIYDLRRDEGYHNIAVLGDLNDTPDSDPLRPLHTSDLKDATLHLASGQISSGREHTVIALCEQDRLRIIVSRFV